MRLPLVLLVALFLVSYAAAAQQPPLPPDLEPVPDSPIEPPALEEDPLQPEVTIIRREDEVIEEYRINDRLYMVRVIPDTGPPYYLIDTDGDGNLETRRSDLSPDVVPPSWVIMSW